MHANLLLSVPPKAAQTSSIYRVFSRLCISKFGIALFQIGAHDSFFPSWQVANVVVKMLLMVPLFQFCKWLLILIKCALNFLMCNHSFDLTNGICHFAFEIVYSWSFFFFFQFWAFLFNSYGSSLLKLEIKLPWPSFFIVRSFFIYFII